MAPRAPPGTAGREERRPEIDPITEYRPLLFAIAYRMLGGVADAEDAVQETCLRWHRALAGGTTIASPKAWLSTVVTRLCLDQLASARVTRETYVGPWLPEPLVEAVGAAGAAPDPAEQAALAESLSTAFLVLLETLSPKERAVFLLHDVFAYDFATIGGIVGAREDACRQVARRARARLVERRPRFAADPAEGERLAGRFLRAVADGDLPGLIATLAEDVTVWSDGGGKVNAARKPVVGREKVATFLLGLRRLAPAGLAFRPAAVNGQPGFVGYVEGRPRNVVALEVGAGGVAAIFIVVNPDKLAKVAPLPGRAAGAAGGDPGPPAAEARVTQTEGGPS